MITLHFKIPFLIVFFGIIFSSCEEKPCEEFEVLPHTVKMPLSIIPMQKSYAIGDTILIDLSLESFYSETTKKHYPVRSGDKITYHIRIIDLEKRREDMTTGEFGLLDFEVIAEREEVLYMGTSKFTANYDFETEVLMSQIRLIPKERSTYMLKISRMRSDFSQEIEWESECRESASFYVKINASPANRNIDIIEGDTSWVENIYGPEFNENSYDSLLNREDQYFFVVEE